MPAKRTNMFVANTCIFFDSISTSNIQLTMQAARFDVQQIRQFGEPCNFAGCSPEIRTVFLYPKRCLWGVCDPKMALPKKLAFELARTPGNFNSLPPAKESGGNFLSQE